jgi:hypothetical protein
MKMKNRKRKRIKKQNKMKKQTVNQKINKGRGKKAAKARTNHNPRLQGHNSRIY